MATLAENLTATTNRLKEAKVAYATAVRNQESSTIVSRAKARLDEAQKAYDLSAPQRSDIATAKVNSDPDVVAAKKLAAEAAAEVAATKISIETAKKNLADTKDANALAAADSKITLLQKRLEEAELAAAEALKAKDDAAIAATQEAARLAAEAAAKEAQDKADQDVRDADTAAKLAQALRDKEAADAAAAAAEAASAEAIAAAQANINQSGNVGIPTVSLSDAAADMYAKELAAKEKTDKALAERQSITEIMTARFKSYGLESLATTIRDLAINDANEDTITLALQETEAYKTRFSANETRKKNGLTALTPGAYLSAEDSYRQTLRAYGLTQFDNDQSVKQFIENDTSPAELSARVQTAVDRLKNADPTIMKTLKDYYKLGDTDILGYVLDTKNQLPDILRKVSTAEIGTAATHQGLKSSLESANALAQQGITQEQAQAG